MGGFKALIGLHVVSQIYEHGGRSRLDVPAVDHQWGGSKDIPVVADEKKEKVSKMAAETYLSAGKQ